MMNHLNRKRICCFPILLLLAWLPYVNAAQVDISARYRGQTDGHFENTTPLPALCWNWPSICESMDAVAVPLTFNKTAINQAPNPRDLFLIKLPGQRRVTLIHESTGDSYDANFEFIAVSQQTKSHHQYFTPVGYNIQGGCSFIEAETESADYPESFLSGPLAIRLAHPPVTIVPIGVLSGAASMWTFSGWRLVIASIYRRRNVWPKAFIGPACNTRSAPVLTSILVTMSAT
ncbi:hypothetical protein [Pseudomonas monteilii]|uniref:hypothetical protein n=1 Tax=Pseudomonas monteilii TaxID=76759 RepID=UPI001602082C|nr:hypothetical protein [Pseudomonas monteilii]